MHIEIRIKGHLAPEWTDWLDGAAIIHEANGEAVITGQLPDQAALLGLLNRLHTLNLAIISVSRSDNPSALHNDADVAIE
jgi:hypothetical protein